MELDQMKTTSSLDRQQARQLFEHYRKQRDGIRNCPELASLCLICGSVHVVPQKDNHRKLYCINCGFAFYRYSCPACGQTVDGRDPSNPGCAECGLRVCSCSSCGCNGQHEKKEQRL